MRGLNSPLNKTYKAKKVEPKCLKNPKGSNSEPPKRDALTTKRKLSLPEKEPSLDPCPSNTDVDNVVHDGSKASSSPLSTASLTPEKSCTALESCNLEKESIKDCSAPSKSPRWFRRLAFPKTSKTTPQLLKRRSATLGNSMSEPTLLVKNKIILAEKYQSTERNCQSQSGTPSPKLHTLTAAQRVSKVGIVPAPSIPTRGFVDEKLATTNVVYCFDDVEDDSPTKEAEGLIIYTSPERNDLANSAERIKFGSESRIKSAPSTPLNTFFAKKNSSMRSSLSSTSLKLKKKEDAKLRYGDGGRQHRKSCFPDFDTDRTTGRPYFNSINKKLLTLEYTPPPEKEFKEGQQQHPLRKSEPDRQLAQTAESGTTTVVLKSCLKKSVSKLSYAEVTEKGVNVCGKNSLVPESKNNVLADLELEMKTKAIIETEICQFTPQVSVNLLEKKSVESPDLIDVRESKINENAINQRFHENHSFDTGSESCASQSSSQSEVKYSKVPLKPSKSDSLTKRKSEIEISDCKRKPSLRLPNVNSGSAINLARSLSSASQPFEVRKKVRHRITALTKSLANNSNILENKSDISRMIIDIIDLSEKDDVATLEFSQRIDEHLKQTLYTIQDQVTAILTEDENVTRSWKNCPSPETTLYSLRLWECKLRSLRDLLAIIKSIEIKDTELCISSSDINDKVMAEKIKLERENEQLAAKIRKLENEKQELQNIIDR